MSAFVVFVPGVPAPQGSKRHVGHGVMVESSARVKPWRNDIIDRCADRGPTITRPVVIEMHFRLPRPRGHYGTGRNAERLRAGAPDYPAGKPDIDKTARAVLDALTIAQVIHDDSLVVDLLAFKRYAALGESPGVSIYVEPMASPVKVAQEAS